MHLPFLAAALATAVCAVAQDPDYPVHSQSVSVDSGYLANAGGASAVLFTHDFTVTDGSFLQLHFRDPNLPPGSRLKLYSLSRVDHVQWLDAASLRAYQFYSCQFLGPTLRLELEAAPNSTGNRVRVDELRALLLGAAGSTDSLCGTDDRVLATDPRASRLDANCTAWLFSPYATATAGHCLSSTAGHLLHFNVPLSTAAGTPVPAAPNDQYALEPFLQQLYVTIGQDWSVMAAVRNSNTHLFPGQAQGSWYTVSNPPPLAAGQVIRITGYGTGTGISGSLTWNQVQTTHTGPRVATTYANALGYQVDTTGGNSGSPIILESSGDAIGIHTNAGCNLNTGIGNTGTSAARADFTAARAAAMALHVVGSFAVFGAGCGGSLGAPQLAFSGVPEQGRSFVVGVTNLQPVANFGMFVAGFAAPAAVSLAGLGLQGCNLLVAPDVLLASFTAAGRASLPVTVPNAPALVGMHTYFQYFALDATAPNSLRGVVSNGGDAQIGN